MNDILTIDQAQRLADLMRGVEAHAKLRYYPDGTDSADNPVTVTLRAFTYDGGALYRGDEDIRDAHVWTSGIFERWFTVRELVAAMANAVQGTDLAAPMAIVETS